MKTLRNVGFCLAVLAFQGSVLRAQVPSAENKNPPPTFSVVSIKPSGPNSAPGYQTTKDRFIGNRSAIMGLIEMAYGLPERRFVIGAPGWVTDDDYDLVAKVDDSDVSAYSALTSAEKPALLRPVLKDRFKLAFHWEERTFPEYALIRSKGGINQANFRPTSSGSGEYQWQIVGRYQLVAKGVVMLDFCNRLLSTEARKLVRDETGLQEKYDFQLRWSRDPEDRPSKTDVSIDAPEIFTAVKEQLGLQMVPRQVSEKVMVIDHIERPTPD